MMISFLNIPSERMCELEDTLTSTIMLSSNPEQFQTRLTDTLKNFTREEVFAMGAVYILLCQEAASAKLRNIIHTPSAS